MSLIRRSLSWHVWPDATSRKPNEHHLGGRGVALHILYDGLVGRVKAFARRHGRPCCGTGALSLDRRNDWGYRGLRVVVG